MSRKGKKKEPCPPARGNDDCYTVYAVRAGDESYWSVRAANNAEVGRIRPADERGPWRVETSEVALAATYDSLRDAVRALARSRPP